MPQGFSAAKLLWDRTHIRFINANYNVILKAKCIYLTTYSYFSIFQIEDAMLMFDKQTNRHRGKFEAHTFYIGPKQAQLLQ